MKTLQGKISMNSFNSWFLTVGFFATVVLIIPAAKAQVSGPITTDSLINHSLNYVDYPPFVRHGEPPEMKPRLGLYFHDFPAFEIVVNQGLKYRRGARFYLIRA